MLQAQKLKSLPSLSKYIGDVDKLLETTPELQKYTPDVFQRSFDCIKKAGFRPEKYPFMISQHPRLLMKPETKILSSLNQWFHFDFGEKETYQLLERYPEFLDIDNFRKVHKNLSIIKSYVGQKNGYKVLRNSPNVALEPESAIEQKVEYLRDVMKCDPVEAYKSNVFSNDLITIKTRHVFMDRLGIYFKKKSEDEEAHKVNKNPQLYKIMDTSDKRFATKVCHVTLEEYETFVEMYKRELEDEASENDSDDNSSDNEDDEEDLSHLHYSR
jgi:mTERF domain-containing protein